MGELMKFDPAEVAKKAKDWQDRSAARRRREVRRPAGADRDPVINDKFDDVASGCRRRSTPKRRRSRR
jgi:hypothetical protein